MIYEWDAEKAAANLAKHGIPFEAVHGFDWTTAAEVEDDRFDYGETRVIAIGWMDAELHTMVYTPRRGRVRVISLRKANARERMFYDQAQEA